MSNSNLPPNHIHGIQTSLQIQFDLLHLMHLRFMSPAYVEQSCMRRGAFPFSAQMYPDVSVDAAADANVPEQWRQLSSIKCPIKITS